MMNNLKEQFNRGPAFIAYITAGQRGLKYSKQAAIALVKGGVDILEIGVPFSDPVADGPVIQRAMNDALASGTNITSVLAMIKEIKAIHDVPIVLFTYYNPLLRVGIKQILTRAKKAGVDGVLVVDLPLEESAMYFECCATVGIEPICIISPSTSEQRLQLISKQCNSFLYYVCRNGTTGVRDNLPANYSKKMQRIKQIAQKPVVAGFGISNQKLAQLALASADGFVVGSLFVEAIEKGATPDELMTLATAIDPR